MNTEEAKKLLCNLGIDPEFNVMEWGKVCIKIHESQLEAYDRKEYNKAEELCELENFISENGGDLHPFPVDSFFHIIPRGTFSLTV